MEPWSPPHCQKFCSISTEFSKHLSSTALVFGDKFNALRGLTGTPYSLPSLSKLSGFILWTLDDVTHSTRQEEITDSHFWIFWGI